MTDFSDKPNLMVNKARLSCLKELRRPMLPLEQRQAAFTRPLVNCSLGRFCVAVIVVLSVFAPRDTAHAHGDGFPNLYVSESGTDEGNCVDPVQPCKTIKYAYGKAEKGDEIRVAPGIYRFPVEHPADALDLLGRIIKVRGGFDPEVAFARRTNDSRVTFLVGPDATYRQRLAANGFLLLQGEVGDARGRIRLAQVEQPSPNTRYVAEGGADEGNCLSPGSPCATIAYALQQATPGQEIRVGDGAFEMDVGALQQATGRNINIRGGFARASNFRAKALAPNIAALSTVVTGPSIADRARLAERGFRLQQDRKHIRAAAAAAPAAIKGGAICESGMADGHPCKGIDRIAQMPLAVFSSGPSEANDIWGFVDKNDNREYAVIGLRNGTAVVDVTDPSSPKEIGTIPGLPTIWRDIKVYQFQDTASGRWKTYAYVTADDNDGDSHGIKIVDLTDLPNSISLAATLDLVDVAHNVYISNVDYATGVAMPGLKPFLYILGSNFGPTSTIGAFFVLDISDPVNPTVIQTPPTGSSYTHDATTLTIDDARASKCNASPCEILIDYSEDSIDIWDMSVKGNASKLGSFSDDGWSTATNYIHSGWWTKNRDFVLVQDEIDEQELDIQTTVHVLDIRDLTAPNIVATWKGPTKAIDHNGFTLGDEYYMSNYRRGLTVLDISRPAELGSIGPSEKARFDTYIAHPDDDAKFNGAWGTYPYLPSGTILVSDIEGGLFLLKNQ